MAQKTILSKKLLEVRYFAHQMEKAGIPYSQVIVFGSYARGTAKPWSDIDVCIVSSSFGKDRHTERVKLMNLKNDMTLDIEPHPYNPQDLNNKWDPLANEIRKYGIKVDL